MIAQPSRRLFFALWPDELTRARVARLGRNAAAALERPARLVNPNNLHITLAFLGEVPESALPGLRKTASNTGSRSFGLQIDHWGWFRKAQILYLAPLDLPHELSVLVTRLRAAVRDCGIETDPRRFRPHLTVARSVTRRVELPAPEGIWWQPEDFALVQSQSGQKGPVYTVLERWQLADSPS